MPLYFILRLLHKKFRINSTTTIIGLRVLLNRFLYLFNGMYERRTSKVCENVKSFYTFNRNLSELSPTFYLLLFILSPFAEIFVGIIIFAFNAID